MPPGSRLRAGSREIGAWSLKALPPVLLGKPWEFQENLSLRAQHSGWIIRINKVISLGGTINSLLCEEEDFKTYSKYNRELFFSKMMHFISFPNKRFKNSSSKCRYQQLYFRASLKDLDHILSVSVIFLTNGTRAHLFIIIWVCISKHAPEHLNADLQLQLCYIKTEKLLNSL